MTPNHVNITYPSVEIVSKTTYKDLLTLIESAGRVCYKSEDKIKEGSAEEFIKGILKRGHEAVLEHGNITAKVICDRGVTHEIVRHRLAAYCQESTRYCNYSKEKFDKSITVIEPSFLNGVPTKDPRYLAWLTAMTAAQDGYFELLEQGCTPQEARSVLPNSLKTEIFMTMDIREWRHFFKLRTAKAAHPDMRVVAIMLLEKFKEEYPLFFSDIEVEE